MSVWVRFLPVSLSKTRFLTRFPFCDSMHFLCFFHLDCSSLGSGLFHSSSAASGITKPCSCNTDLDAVALLFLPLIPCCRGSISNASEMCPLSHGVSWSPFGFHATHSKCLNILPSLSTQLIQVYNSCYAQLLNLSAQNMLCSAGVPHSEFIKTWLCYHLFPSQELWELWHRRKTKTAELTLISMCPRSCSKD